VGDALFAGFTTLGTGTPINLLSLKYAVMEKVRAVVMVGSDGSDPYAGLGFEIIPLGRKFGGSFGTELKLQGGYLFTSDAIDEGTLFFGVSVGVGI
jgi:hypothetical protein